MTPGETPALECVALRKNFGALQAVREISFAVAAGEILGVVGPNGAGKTTLFNLLSGHVGCDGGKIRLDGADVTALPPHQRFRLGMARTFQIPQAFNSQTVFDNALAGAVFGGKAGRLPLIYSQASKAAAEKALSDVDLLAKRTQMASSLSPFDKKRLMIASAIAGGARVLLLDEPFGGLSEGEIEIIEDVAWQLNRSGMTLIIVEHVLRALFKLARHVFVMQHGERIFEGSPEDFMKDETVIASYLGKTQIVQSQVLP